MVFTRHLRSDRTLPLIMKYKIILESDLCVPCPWWFLRCSDFTILKCVDIELLYYKINTAFEGL